MSSTAACGTAPRSWRSLHAGTFRWHSGSLFSAGGRSRHRERTGLWQERRDKTERSGDAHRSGGLGLEKGVGGDGKGQTGIEQRERQKRARGYRTAQSMDTFRHNSGKTDPTYRI